MKKIILLILVLIICLGLVACGDTSGESANGNESTPKENDRSGILDLCKEWHSLSSRMSISFNTKGTCTFDGSECKYEYDKAKGIISIYDTYTVNLNVVIRGDATWLKTQDVAFVPLAAYEKYDEAYLEAYTDNLCVLSAVSDNLAPTLNKGESAFFKYVEDCGDLRVGDVVSYWTVINGEQVVNIGQILEVGANDGGVISFQVKEDVETVWGAIQSPTVIGKLVQVIGE